MRVFCAVRHSNDPSRHYGGLWSGNFYPALRSLGHEVIESHVDLLPTSRFMGIADGFTREELALRGRTTEAILDEVKQAVRSGPIDVFLSYFYNAHFDPAGFDELRRLGVPSINYYCNSIHQFSQVRAIAAKADFSWHAERDARQAYLDAGAQAGVGADGGRSAALSSGQRRAPRREGGICGAKLCRSQPVDGGTCDERHAGGRLRPRLGRTRCGGRGAPGRFGRSRSLSRPGGLSARLTRQLQQSNTRPLAAQRLAGAGADCEALARAARAARLIRATAPHAKGAIPFTQIAEVFSSYEVCLNFSNVWADAQPGAALIPHVRLRNFEGPMCRTCYLTGHTDEITEFYEVGKEIDTYRTEDELVDKTRYYLAHPEAAERLREAGWQRARRDHTWERRFVELFGKTGLG